jgi:hypothetical protein
VSRRGYEPTVAKDHLALLTQPDDIAAAIVQAADLLPRDDRS